MLLGGVLTGLLTWHWIFLVNVPIGIAVWVLATRLLPPTRSASSAGRLDVTGAALVTVALMLAVYGVVGGNDAGWTSTRTLGLLAPRPSCWSPSSSARHASTHPLVPLRLFKLRNVSISQVVGVLWAGAMFACFFLSALYLQRVLGYDAARGRPRLPAVVRGDGRLLAADLRQARDEVRHPSAARRRASAWPRPLALFALAPVDGDVRRDVLPPMVLLGLGAGIAFNPVLLAAMGDVEPHEAGLASGVVNTSFMMGGALGLAVLVAVSSWRTGVQPDPSSLEALNGGFQVAFAVGAVFAARPR